MPERADATTDHSKLNQQPGWSELWLKEDWWAVWIGLTVVLIAYGMFASGSSIGWVAVAPAKWSTSMGSREGLGGEDGG